MSVILARPGSRKDRMRATSRQESWARKAAWDLAKNILQAQKNKDETALYSPVEVKAPVLFQKSLDERMVVVDSGASMHMLRKRDVSPVDMDTLRRFRTPSTVVTANGEVQTKRGSTSICSRSWPLRDSAISIGAKR